MKSFTITQLEAGVLQKMKQAGFAENTISIYRREFQQFKSIAFKLQGTELYNNTVANAFMADTSHIIPANSEFYYGYKSRLNKRCIKFIESFISSGEIDFSSDRYSAKYPIESDELSTAFDEFAEEMRKRKLKPNTVQRYKRFIHYFIKFLEGKGVKSLNEIQHGDILSFMSLMCEKHYQPTSLNAVVPALNLLISLNEPLAIYKAEVPNHLPQSRRIRDTYSDAEYDQMKNCIHSSDRISLRDKAISLMAFDTGFRAVDICLLKLQDIDWEHDCIHITQEKTTKTITIPLTAEIGNAIVEYLMEERPKVDSDYVFLSSFPPYSPLSGHTPVRHLLVKVLNEANIEPHSRIYGTRITRHSFASRMLRKGVPIQVITEALGHRNPDTSMIYISTDNELMAKCTLPLPKGGMKGEN